MSEAVACPVCAGPLRLAFRAQVLRKHDVAYYSCAACGLLKTEKPYWLEEAYRSAIADADTGLVDRNLGNCERLELILACLGLGRGRLVDLAGGYGLLTRLMRSAGYECYSTDKYCENLFAREFEPPPGLAADALLAFEVFEHLEDPVGFVEEAFARFGCRTLVFTTLTLPRAVPPPEWWYYAFDGGQHITFYQPRTLARIAERFGCRHYLLKRNLHVITDVEPGRTRRLLLTRPRLRRLYAAWLRSRRAPARRVW